MVKDSVLIIERPNFVVKLHEDVIEVDMKGGARKEFEDVVESVLFFQRTCCLRHCLTFNNLDTRFPGPQ